MTKSLNFTLYSGPRTFTNVSTWFQNDVRELSDLCREFVGDYYSIDIVNLIDHRQRAFRAGVHTTPAVLVELPCGRLQNLGGFSETKRFLQNWKSEKSLPPALNLL